MQTKSARLSLSPAHRVIAVPIDGRLNAKPIHVTITPSGLIVFREHGRRVRYELPLATAFWTAAKAKAAADRAEKQQRKRSKNHVKKSGK